MINFFINFFISFGTSNTQAPELSKKEKDIRKKFKVFLYQYNFFEIKKDKSNSFFLK